MKTAKPVTGYKITKRCECCAPKGKPRTQKCMCSDGVMRRKTAPIGKILTYEGNLVDCPYCDETGKRHLSAPHPSHKMSKRRTEIRCPGSTERFYSVRHCIKCGREELEHAAGHFLNGLDFPCKGIKDANQED